MVRFWRVLTLIVPLAWASGVSVTDAAASSVTVSDGVLFFESGPGGEVIQVSLEDEVLQISDGGIATPGPGCARASSEAVHCRGRGIAKGVISTSGGDDEVRIAGHVSVPMLIRVGAGDDAVTGGGGDDDIFGDDGRDTLDGAGGNDRVDGGEGPDRINGGPEDDLLVGGADDELVDAGDERQDRLECGTGFDRVHRDGRDQVSEGCQLTTFMPTADALTRCHLTKPDLTLKPRRGKRRRLSVYIEATTGYVVIHLTLRYKSPTQTRRVSIPVRTYKKTVIKIVGKRFKRASAKASCI